MSLPSARTLALRREGLELAAAVILEGGLEGAGHFEGDGGGAGDGDDGVLVELDDLVGPIIHDDIAGSGAAIASDENAILIVKGEDGGRFGVQRSRGRGSAIGRTKRFGHGGSVPRHAKQFGEIPGSDDTAAISPAGASSGECHWPVRWR